MELMIARCCILILMLTQDIINAEIRLDQSSAVVKKPGETVKISCKISGFTMTDYYMHWIRQKPGEALEWIGRMSTGSNSATYADSMKDHFIMTEDVPSSTQFLEAKSLRAEDTAVYYCGRWGGGFDYWGKGTQVTVQGKEMPLSIYPVMECSSASEFKLGCISTGLQTDSPFQWLDGDKNALTSFDQFPALPRDGAYAKISVITVKRDEWNKGKRFACKVGNGTLNIPEDKKPRVNLVKVSDGDSVMCVVEDFFPKELTIKLKEDGHEVSGQNWPAILNTPAMHYTAGSLLKVNKAAWDKNVKYSCEVIHENQNYTRLQSFTGKFTVEIYQPVAKKLFINKKAEIKCVVSGENKMDVEGTQVSWKVGDTEGDKTKITDDQVKQTDQLYIKTSTLTLDESDWFSGAEVECSTLRDQNKISKKVSIKYGDESCSVQIYIPQEPVENTEKISLVCQANSSRLGDVYFMWEKGDGQFIEGTTTAPVNKGNSMYVLNILTVTKDEYNSGMLFTCAVKHAHTKNDSSPKTATTSKRETDPGLYINCDKDTAEEDDFNSLWSTASSFIFLFLFTLIYSTILSLSKIKS